MAAAVSLEDALTLIAQDESDYGSDFDDATALELVSQAESQPLKDVVLESIEEPVLSQDVFREEHLALHVPRPRQSLSTVQQVAEPSVEVEYDENNREAFSPEVQEESTSDPPKDAPIQSTREDKRSPLERFRKPPKKPLSVTDLVSPAWCEQQYEYSLTKYGRVKQTPAMKQGSRVHEKLEAQVHERVPVEVVTREDRFGLRIWNAIQGLRSLRQTGLTRELEIWGLVEGEVVNGVIDEISSTCPDEEMEAQVMGCIETAKSSGKGGKSKKSEQASPDQRTLAEFLHGSQNGRTLESHSRFLGKLQDKSKTFYLVDVKTRQTRTVPATGKQSRPTYMQLMLYYRILSSLANNEIEAQKVFQRYNMNPQARFSDTFIQQVANLDVAALAVEQDGTETDILSQILEHNTLASLWALLISEYALTLPTNSSESSISSFLTAEFRTAHTHEGVPAGAFIGRRSFTYDADALDEYVKDEMTWWRGERETKGVDIEDSYKCRICGFAEECTWRATKIEEGIQKARLRKEKRHKSEV